MLFTTKRSSLLAVFLVIISKLSATSNDTIVSDTLVSDTLNLSTKIVGKVSSKTLSLSDYFSFSNIIISLILIAITFVFMRILSGLLIIWAERTTKHRITIKGFIPIIRIIVWVGTLLFILIAVFQPPMASLLAFSASVGVAIGFAAQDLLKNIFGGIIILTDKPFQIGDKVQIGSHYGEVTGIGLRSTRITTADDNLITVPNSSVMSESVSNANSGEENCQVVTVLYLPLTIDIKQVKKAALEAAKVSKFIYLNKPVAVLFFQETLGPRVMLKVKVKAYVNDIRNEFAFMSEITEVLTHEFGAYYSNEPKSADKFPMQ